MLFLMTVLMALAGISLGAYADTRQESQQGRIVLFVATGFLLLETLITLPSFGLVLVPAVLSAGIATVGALVR